VHVGISVDQPVDPDGEIAPGFFPEGSYVVTTHTGHYKNLREAHMQLDAWVKEQAGKSISRLLLLTRSLGQGRNFYITDPNIETNPEKWVTEIVMLVTEDHS
jgi:effector-binding domain-containing protein